MDDALIYQHDTRSFTVFYDGDVKQFKEWLRMHGFIDAEILSSDWWVIRYEVFKLPRDYALQLRENGYLCMEYVGHLNWVIPKDEQTEDQYYFIKGIFEPR